MFVKGKKEVSRKKEVKTYYNKIIKKKLTMSSVEFWLKRVCLPGNQTTQLNHYRQMYSRAKALEANRTHTQEELLFPSTSLASTSSTIQTPLQQFEIQSGSTSSR